MARYNIDTVKQAASGRWPEIFAALTSTTFDIFDGRHHACPKCGGKDRFRFLDDEAGACLCNQCFSTKNGDGFAVLQWLTGNDFKWSLEAVAGHLGINPEKGSKQRNPAEHLEFLPWNPTIVGLWCLKKKPIKPDAVKAIGGKVAKYRKQYTVIAIPVWGPSLQESDPVGWVLYRADGGDLPTWPKRGADPVWVKMLTTYGSDAGIMFGEVPFGSDDPIWKTEGPGDLLALMSVKPGVPCFTNSGGAGQQPQEWISKSCESKVVFVIHDADKPGQDGATWKIRSDGNRRPGWCPKLALLSEEVRNVTLPFPVELSNGPDLRDYFAGGGTWDGLIERAESAEVFDEDPEAGEPDETEHPDDPHRLARVNLARYEEVGRTLRFWKGTWYSFRGTHYEEIEPDHLVARINMSIKSEFDRIRKAEHEKYIEWKRSSKYDPDKDKGPPKSRKVTDSLVKNVCQATKGMQIMGQSTKIETWINGGPSNCVSCKNGILDIGSLVDVSSPDPVLLEHSQDWFSTISLPYEYDESADCPEWQSFLQDIFNGDSESIAVLQMWMGYLLVKSDNLLNKIMFIIGKPRSGKGTILKVIRSVLGEQNIATPTISEMAEKFGMEGLIGKSAALIADARLSKRTDETIVTERLLSISGNDPQNIQRKYKATLAGYKMNTRFTLFSNLLPRLQDLSAAFVTRCVFLHTPNCYLGREDVHLFDRLEAELPGILNWCIAGRMMLEDGNWRIKQPESGQGLVKEMNSIISPVKMFITETCVVSLDREYATTDLFEMWERWCRENDIVHVGNIQSFSRKLKATEPLVDTTQRKGNSSRWRVFLNISPRRESNDEETKF